MGLYKELQYLLSANGKHKQFRNSKKHWRICSFIFTGVARVRRWSTCFECASMNGASRSLKYNGVKMSLVLLQCHFHSSANGKTDSKVLSDKAVQIQVLTNALVSASLLRLLVWIPL